MFATYNKDTKIIDGLWEFTPPNNIPYVEFPNEYLELMGDLRYYFIVDNGIVIKKENKTQVLNEELNSLEKWFNEYDNQVKQYERCKRLGLEFDKTIEELDAQATINQKRIAEIRNILKGQ